MVEEEEDEDEEEDDWLLDSGAGLMVGELRVESRVSAVGLFVFIFFIVFGENSTKGTWTNTVQVKK